MTSSSYTIDLEPVGRRVQVGTKSTLLAAAQAAGVELVAVCGGIGSCGTCRVRLMTGELSPLTLIEEVELGLDEIAAGFRLACQARPVSDVRLDIPPESLTTPQRLQVEGQGVEVGLDPVVVP
ncbi:MAG TPA: 2Fe-2S iron-sulfur cluster-binding protein, partial [Anaerolineales bacterium]|nr:2Fe-2S iron-sulfur cluster-binding protein [Anaerolineales bacterium]